MASELYSLYIKKGEEGITLKKKILWKALELLLVLIMIAVAILGALRLEIFIDESPNGDYQIISWWINQGGGAFYVKEKGLFSKWHKIGNVPFSSEWLSETEFSIDYPYLVDDDYCKEYNVNEFLDK